MRGKRGRRKEEPTGAAADRRTGSPFRRDPANFMQAILRRNKLSRPQRETVMPSARGNQLAFYGEHNSREAAAAAAAAENIASSVRACISFGTLQFRNYVRKRLASKQAPRTVVLVNRVELAQRLVRGSVYLRDKKFPPTRIKCNAHQT